MTHEELCKEIIETFNKLKKLINMLIISSEEKENIINELLKGMIK